MLREMISEILNTRGFNVIASSGDAKDTDIKNSHQ